MRKIFCCAIVVLFLPIVTISILLFFEKNVFDNPDFWYGYMAYFGTIVLGAIALGQSQKANDTNDRLLKLQEELQRFQIKDKASPVGIHPIIVDPEREYYVAKDDDFSDEFDVVNQKYNYFFYMDCPNIDQTRSKLYNIVIEIENASDIVLKEICVNHLRLYDIISNASGVGTEKESIREYIYLDNSPHSVNVFLKPGEKTKLCLKICMDEYDLSNESFHVDFDLCTMSIYNVLFAEHVSILRNNVVDRCDRVFLSTEREYCVHFPEAIPQ